MPRARKQSAPGPRRSSRRRASSSPYADTPNRAPADHAADRSGNARADRSGNARAEQDDIPSAVPQPASLLKTGLNPRSVTAAVSTALHPLLARVERLEERISARQDPDGHAQAAVPSVADVVQTASNTVTHHPPQVDSGPMDISLMQPALPPIAAPMANTRESSSIVPTVPRKLLDKITRGEYIELEDLLPENVGAGSEPLELSTANGEGRRVSLNLCVTKKRSIVDFTAWLEAYTIYMACALKHVPFRALELVTYQHIICTANQQFATPAVLGYDRAFRAAVATTSARWDAIDQSLWSLHLIRAPRPSCPRCTTHHSRDRCPQYLAGPHAPAGTNTSRPTQPFLAGAGSTRQICLNFNRGRPCQHQPCERLHVCSTCGDRGHPAARCTNDGRRGPRQTDKPVAAK